MARVLTPEQRAHKQERDRLRQRNRTPEMREKQRLRSQLARANWTPEQRARKLENDKLRRLARADADREYRRMRRERENAARPPKPAKVKPIEQPKLKRGRKPMPPELRKPRRQKHKRIAELSPEKQAELRLRWRAQGDARRRAAGKPERPASERPVPAPRGVSRPRINRSCADCGARVANGRKGQAVRRCLACYRKSIHVAKQSRLSNKLCRVCQKVRVSEYGGRCWPCAMTEKAVAERTKSQQQDALRKRNTQARRMIGRGVTNAESRALDQQQLREKRALRRRPDKWYLEYAPGEEWALDSVCTGRTMSRECTNGPGGLPVHLIMPGMCYTCATGRPRKYRATIHPPKNLTAELAEDLKFAKELVA